VADTQVVTVTFVFDDFVISTSVTGKHEVIPRASELLSQECAIDTDKAIEVHVHEHR
jgi:hypothetical protein